MDTKRLIFVLKMTCLIILLTSFARIEIRAQSSSKILKLIPSIPQDVIDEPNVLNYMQFLNEIGDTKEMKILQDAGLPCSVTFDVLVSEEGRYLFHRYTGDKCHPLAEEMIDSVISVLTFESAKRNGRAEEMWVEMRINWTTW